LPESVVFHLLELLGSFRLLAPGGARIDVSSKKGQALIAMLAVAGGGERTRSWLQDRLWGSRQDKQAQASLRNELSSLKAVLNQGDRPLIFADHARIWLDLSHFKIDAREMDGGSQTKGEFLEGLDIPGEDGFEDWLREERARIEALAERSSKREKVIPSVAPPAPLVPEQFSKLPALAVLPFANLTGDPAKDIFAEGISEDLLDRLSRLRWLPIISRGSSFGFRGSDIDPKIIGEQLGARYVLEGRLRSERDGLILAASLIDAESGQMIWSNKQMMDDASPTALEDLLTGLTLTLGAKIDQQEQGRTLRKPQSDLNVRELIWRGRWHLNRFTLEDSDLAKSLFQQALDREPTSPEAIIQMTNAILWDAWARRGSVADVKVVRQMAQKAIIADYDDARGHMMAGIAESFLRQPIRAEAHLLRSIELNPSLFLAHGYLGSTHYLNDSPQQAIEAFNFAVRISPNDQHLFHIFGEMAMSYLMMGDPAKAVEYAENSTARRASYWFASMIKVCALVEADDLKEAQSSYQELVTTNPKFDEGFIDWVPFCDTKWNDFLKKGMNLARG
jgi:TolB-like protein